MSRRTRKTILDTRNGPTRGCKTRFKSKKSAKHGPIKRLVGNEPMKSLRAAAIEAVEKENIALLSDERFDALMKYAPEE